MRKLECWVSNVILASITKPQPQWLREKYINGQLVAKGESVIVTWLIFCHEVHVLNTLTHMEYRRMMSNCPTAYWCSVKSPTDHGGRVSFNTCPTVPPCRGNPTGTSILQAKTRWRLCIPVPAVPCCWFFSKLLPAPFILLYSTIITDNPNSNFWLDSK